MLLKKTVRETFDAEELTIPEWELAILDVFIRGASMFGVRKSIAMVYGAIYCSREPISTQFIQQKLRLSRGAVVEALQFLRRLGAIRICLKIGERRDYFSAERDLKKIARELLKEVVEPALEKADIRLAQAEEASSVEEPSEDAAFARSRISELTQWKSRFAEILPLLETFLGK